MITSGSDGIRIWDIETGSSQVLSERPGVLEVSHDGKLALVGRQGENDEAVLYDLEQDAAENINIAEEAANQVLVKKLSQLLNTSQ